MRQAGQVGFQRKHTLRKISIFSALMITLACLAIWKTSHSDCPLFDVKSWLSKGECKPLFQIARRILDGEKIPLPFGGQETLWPFKDRVSKSHLLNILNYKDSKSSEETPRKFKYYNVSARDMKSRKIFITFGHNCCGRAKRRAVDKAKSVGGFDCARSFDMSSLSSKFRQTHSNVLTSGRGAGYWLWKPYILLKTLMEDMVEGDLVMYQDAGAYLIKSAAPLLKLCQESEHGIVVFTLDKTEDEYTKKDALILMDMNISEAARSYQRLASFVIVRKTCSSVQFVMEWLAYLSDRRIASDDGNTMGMPNAKSFRDHRHDQSVLSLLSKKWGIPALRDPSQFGNGEIKKYSFSSPYEQLVVHDRFKS